MSDDLERTPSERGTAARTSEFLEIVERVERLTNTVEILLERTNTLGRLLDLLNKRLEQLELRG